MDGDSSSANALITVTSFTLCLSLSELACFRAESVRCINTVLYYFKINFQVFYAI